ncbi:MAG: 50S ribosomal protein L24 [Clostridiales bacterium]|nr:50S ribosomal protein L24 [Clostridiales bacterium]
MSYSVKKGDFVKIIAGDDKGKMAQIIAIDTQKGRVALEGKDIAVNKKARKARKANDKSGIISIPRTIAISNVMPVCAACGNTTRVKNSIIDGKKERVCKCGAVLETKKVAVKEEKKAKATVRRRTKIEDKAVETAKDAEVKEVKTTAEVSEPEAKESEKVAEVKAETKKVTAKTQVKKPAAKAEAEEGTAKADETKE